MKSFLTVMVADMEGQGKMAIWYPCCDCKNEKKFPKPDNVYDHLLRHGFKERYHVWNKHNEEGLNKGEMD